MVMVIHMAIKMNHDYCVCIFLCIIPCVSLCVCIVLKSKCKWSIDLSCPVIFSLIRM